MQLSCLQGQLLLEHARSHKTPCAANSGCWAIVNQKVESFSKMAPAIQSDDGGCCVLVQQHQSCCQQLASAPYGVPDASTVRRASYVLLLVRIARLKLYASIALRQSVAASAAWLTVDYGHAPMFLSDPRAFENTFVRHFNLLHQHQIHNRTCSFAAPAALIQRCGKLLTPAHQQQRRWLWPANPCPAPP